MSIRDLVVGIEFDNVDVSELLRVDSAMDEIEDQLRSMGINIDDATGEFETLGTAATGALSDITAEAGNAGNAMNDLNSTGLNTLNNAVQTGIFTQQNFNQAAQQGGWILTQLKTLGVAAFAAIGAAAGVAAGAVVATVMEEETAFDRLEAKTGAIGAELEGLKNISKDVFVSGFGQDLLQVTDDVATMRAMFGDLNKEELTALTKSAYTISDLWGYEVKEVGKTVKTMTSQFKGLSEADALDLMTTAFQETGDHSDDLLDTFTEYSGYFKELGFDAKGFTNVLVKGAKAGAFTTDLAADAIKEFGIRSIDASDSTAEGFKAIGLDAKKMTKNFAEGGDKAQQAFAATVAGLSAMKDPVEQNAAGVALFGTQWEDLREGVILAMTDGTDAIGHFKGATQEAGDAAYDNFGSRMTSVFRDLKTKISEAFNENGGQELLNALATKAEELVPKIEAMVGKAVDFANAIRDNWPAIRETIIGLSVAVGSFAAIMGALKIISVINTLMIAFRTGTVLATLAQWGLNAAMLANPITWVVAAIAGLIAIGVLLYRNWDTVKAKLGEFWSAVKEKFAGIKEAISNAIQPILGWFDSLKTKWDNFKNSISNFKMPKIGIPKALGGNGLIQKADGSHATGLASVPFDGYNAILHKNESILTAKQSDALRAAGILNSAGSKPRLNMGDQVSPTKSSKSGSTVFAPNVNITVNGAGSNADEIGKKAAIAARKEIERLFTHLGLAFE